MKFNPFKLLSSVLFVVLANVAFAQLSTHHTHQYKNFYEGVDLMEKEKFLPAQKKFSDFQQQIIDKNNELLVQAEFYEAYCASQLFHDNAPGLLAKFIERRHESQLVVRAKLELAYYYFRIKKYRQALEAFEKVDRTELFGDKVDEFYFKRGYAYFENEELDKASKDFYEIKDKESRYTTPARYFFAHISYTQGNYETALIDFLKIAEEPAFSPFVPYYLTQIYYRQAKYDELLGYAPAILDTIKTSREAEISRLIADAYFQKGKFEDAIPYLERYNKKMNFRLSPEESYVMGYSYYKVGDCNEAVRHFQKATQGNDTLAQVAYYKLGECYIKSNEKNSARSAFKNSARLGIDDRLSEDALFNYAKLSYELSYHPYDDAVIAFEEFINKYPKSKKLDQAYEYLIGVYSTTKNYAEALNSIDRIKNPPYKILEARQRLAYFRGVELFNNKNYRDAEKYFLLSIEDPYDQPIYAKTLYWLAETYYNLGDYDNAINNYQEFLFQPGSTALSFYNNAHYNMGYSYFKKKSWQQASFWFRGFLAKEDKTSKTPVVQDALLRTADCFFISRNYANAIDYYNKAIAAGAKDKDYATLQVAIAHGVEGDYTQKAATLKKFVDEFPLSLYTDDALLELGSTYLLINKTAEAKSSFERLIQDFGNSNLLAEALLKKGLIEFNAGDDKAALKTFDRVVKEFSGTADAAQAVEKIRQIYLDDGDIVAFENYIKGVKDFDFSKGNLDSTAYQIAENQYLRGNCEKAIPALSGYIDRYPKGIFLLQANFYLADCQHKVGFKEEALKGYDYVLASNWNKFSENALVAKAGILYENNDMPNAAKAYKQLEQKAQNPKNIELAARRLMEINYKTGEHQEAIVYAQKRLQQAKLSEQESARANLILAKSYLAVYDTLNARTIIDSLSLSSTQEGAEAKYILARLQYIRGLYDASEKTIYRLVDQVPSYPEWIGRGFIVLAENYIAKGDVYNARVTLQSVIDNSENDDLITQARRRLLQLEEEERMKDVQSLPQDTIDLETQP